MKNLPTGTVTFLFTDIEGSTRLLQHLEKHYAEALMDCRGILRAAIQEWGGREVNSQGDALLAAFPRARDALIAAIAAQRGLAEHRWPGDAVMQVRMGMHTGEPQVLSDDYVGIDVHRAARIAGAGHGGQIILSDTSQALIAKNLPDGVTLRDLGEHRLKDLVHPLHLFQVALEDLPADFPPLRTLTVLPNNLPHQLSSFVGRTRQAAEISRLLSRTRLVTLTGTGGCGKTRLALHVAAGLVHEFPDGAWLVELGALSDSKLIPQAVMSALHIPQRPGAPPGDVLSDYLQSKSLLLLLDNCEHLAEACARLVDTVLRVCPDLRILATSREALRVAGESTYRVPSLSLPDIEEGSSVESVIASEAVLLFVDRAKAASTTFDITAQNAATVACLCRRLDGIPLAIELAAARANALSPEQILARLGDRFRLLTGGQRTSPARHQTLQAAMDWSYDLLSDSERALARRLAVFAGGWTLGAAEQVCSEPPISAAEVPALLAQLVDKSLVAMERQGEEARYWLLETVRQYLQKAAAEAQEMERTRRRHRDWYAELADTAERECVGRQQSFWCDRLELEHDNFRAALDWSLIDCADSGVALHLAGALYPLWYLRGHFTEGREWLERALSRSAAAPPFARAKALHTAGWLAQVQLDDVRAVELAEENLALQRQLGDTQGTARALILFGAATQNRGDYETARQHLEQGLTASRKLGDTVGMGIALNNLGQVARRRRDYAAARSAYEEALALRRDMGDEGGTAVQLDNLGRVAMYEGQWDRAEALLAEAVTIRHRLGFKWGIATSLTGLAAVAAERGMPERAARLLGAAEALLGTLGAYLYKSDRLDYERTVTRLQASMDETALRMAKARGQAMTLTETIAYIGSPE